MNLGGDANLRGDVIRVTVDPDLEDLVPDFLDRRRVDVHRLREALERADYRSIHRLGHNLKGDGGALGFDGLSEIGRDLERAALDEDATTIRGCLQRLTEYLARVEVVTASEPQA